MLARDAQETGAIGLGGLFSPLAISLVTCHNPFIGFFLRVCKNYFKKFSVGPLKPIFILRAQINRALDADEGKIAHDMIAFMELKWPPGGIKT